MAGPMVQKRFLNLHEYQSKALMNKYGVRVQRGQVASTVQEAEAAAKSLAAMSPNGDKQELVLKSQIHAGGRGKGTFNTGYKGGVKVYDGANRVKQVAEAAKAMLGNRLVTNQTGPEGALVEKVLVHEGVQFQRELYFALLMDRAYGGPVMVYSKQGGVDIEETAHTDPGAIKFQPIDIKTGPQESQLRKVAEDLGFTGPQAADAVVQFGNLYKLFIGSDATQVEINPFVLATDGLIYCVDAKINFDDNASFRQEPLFAERDFTQEDPREVAASKFNLNYVGLDGNIGCMVNGAGLAMATMDIIKLHGGDPANFLDVGGGANEKQVEEAFKILTADPKVKAILVNIFGGIMKCDTIAQGIINAARNINLSLPLVVRLEGTNVERGNQLLKDSGIKLQTAKDLDDAAIKAVKSLA